MTPTAGSNFSRYVIPTEINPEGICCICVPVPDSREYRAQFMGAIWRMGIQTHYERDPAHSGKLVAAVWRKIWEDLQVSDCGCSPLTGSQDLYDINIQTQILIQTWYQIWEDAAFDIDVAFPATPDLFDSDPGDAGDEIPQRNRALCMAVSSWVDELMNRGLSYAREAGVAIGGVVAGGFAVPLVPVQIVIGGVVLAGFALSELVQEMMSTPYRDYLKCGMFAALQGQDTNSTAAFSESWDNLPVRPPPPESAFQDAARDVIEAWGRSQLNNVDNYLGFIKTLNRAMGVASSLTDEDCICTETETWCWEIDFTVTDGGFVDTGICGGFGLYVPGVGWKSESSGPSQSLCLHQDIGSSAWTHAEATITTDGPLTGPGAGRNVVGWLATVIQFDEPGSTDEGTFTTIWDGIATLDKIIINPSGGSVSEGGILLTHALFRGTGSNPFGVDNC